MQIIDITCHTWGHLCDRPMMEETITHSRIRRIGITSTHGDASRPRVAVIEMVENNEPSEHLHAIDERRRNLGAFYVQCDMAVAEALGYGRNVLPLSSG